MLPRGAPPRVSNSSSMQEGELLHTWGSGSGVGASVRKWLEGHRRYFDAMAILESLVAIMSGITVWLGTWDLLDNHLLPDTVTSKLLLIIFSLLALYASRTLYDKELTVLREKERRRRMSVPSNTPHAAPHASDVHLEAPAGEQHAALDQTNGGADSAATPPLDANSAPARSTLPVPPLPMRRLYFDAPPFSAARFARASFALLASLTLWIGMWDMLDYHIIPGIFKVCVNDEWQCSFVKAGCVVIGLTGLYLTRTLYGTDSVKNAHFSRMK